MLGGFVSTISGEWNAWKLAFKELPDNPLANYLALLRKRRLAKLPWAKRNKLLLVGGCLSVMSAFSAFTMLLTYSLGMSPSLDGDNPLFLLVSGNGLLYAISIAVFFWLVQILFTSLISALAFLGIHGHQDSGGKFDDLIGGSTISNRALAAAVVNHNFGLLAKPIIALTAVRQVSNVMYLASYESFSRSIGNSSVGHGYGDNVLEHLGAKERILQFLFDLPVWQLKLVTLPFDLVLSVVANLLGALLLIVLFIVLGRHLRQTAAIPATVFLSILWIIISGLAFVSSYSIFPVGYSMGFPLDLQIPFSNQVQWMLIGSLVVPCLCIFVLYSFLRRTEIGTSILLLTGLVFSPLLMAAGFSPFGLNLLPYNPASPFSPESMMMTLNEIAWGSMVFSPFTQLGVLPEMGWSFSNLSVEEFCWHELFRAPILILVQVLTLAAISQILLKAVSLRRQGQG